MLTATRREWNELYVFFNFLAQGGIVLGNATFRSCVAYFSGDAAGA